MLLSARAKPISVLITPDGMYEFEVLPFVPKWLKLVPAPHDHHQLGGGEVLTGQSGHLQYLLREAPNPSQCLWDPGEGQPDSQPHHSNLTKSKFRYTQLTFLDHVVSQRWVAPVQVKVEAVLQYPAPDNKPLMCFFGMAGYYRQFYLSFSWVGAPSGWTTARGQ